MWPARWIAPTRGPVGRGSRYQPPEIDDGEDHNPDRVDKVPVRRDGSEARVPAPVVTTVPEVARECETQENRQGHDPERYVQPVEAGQRKERSGKEAGAHRYPLAQQSSVLGDLSEQKRRSQDDRRGEPEGRSAIFSPPQGTLGQQGRAATGEQGDAEGGRPRNLQILRAGPSSSMA